ncbi:MAG: ATP-binding protein [Eggerthellaceae bacterium]|nr:ATP-binding protein [Eggerthellaceae bacterium]
MSETGINDGMFGMSIELEPTPESVVSAADFVEEWLDARAVPIKPKARLMVAVDEIYSNIVRCSAATRAELSVAKKDGDVVLTFRDNGTPFNPLELEDPDIAAPAEERALGGLGIFIVKKTMDDVRYEQVEGDNVLTLVLGVWREPAEVDA